MPQAVAPCTNTEEVPRRALRIARFFLGEEYDEEATAAEIVVILYSAVIAALLASVLLAVGLLYWLISTFVSTYGGIL